MNKTVTVNIGGIVFHIDENAYDRFKQYLEAIRGHFTTAEGRDEIMQDIESRIAEMFMARIKDSKQVITLEDVDEVTKQMGKPEDFGGSAEPSDASSSATATTTTSAKKRIFRNPDDKMLGGVCSGVAAYVDTDPIWFRLAFAVCFFCFGFGFLLYIILWILIPEAKTTTEKLQMRGEPVTVSNIEKNVKEELDHLKKKVDEFSKGGIAKRSGTIVGRILEAIGEVFIILFKVLGKIIAAFFIFIGIIVTIALLFSMLALMGVPGIQYPHVLDNIFRSGSQFAITFIGAVLVVGIPFIMLAYTGLRLLFNIKKHSRVIGFTALGLWLAGLVICTVNGFYISKQFARQENVRKEITLAQPASNMVYLELNTKKNDGDKYDDDDSNLDCWDMDRSRQVVIDGKEYTCGRVQLDILKSPTDSFELTEIFYARGQGRKEAAERASHIAYSFAQRDSLIVFEKFFTVDRSELFRAQKVQLILRLPVGARVHLDNSLRGFIYDVDNLENIYDHYMTNRTWEMTEKGLRCMDCNGKEKTIDGNNWDSGDDEFDFDNGGIHVHSEHGDEVHIDKYGVHINGRDNVGAKNFSTLTIDENGVQVKQDGKDVIKIDKDGVVIDTKEKKKDK
jgi:phage shock protein PspC (stress-responsive transcriptional regulator)